MRVALVGTGLIGASVGLAAKKSGAQVVGFDPDEQTLEVAAEKGAIDEQAGSREDAVREADLAVVAAPVAQLAREVADGVGVGRGRGNHGWRRLHLTFTSTSIGRHHQAGIASSLSRPRSSG